MAGSYRWKRRLVCERLSPDQKEAKMAETGRSKVPKRADVVIVGAGFAGMYLLKLMRDNGFDAVALEQGGGVGGAGTGIDTPVRGAM